MVEKGQSCMWETHIYLPCQAQFYILYKNTSELWLFRVQQNRALHEAQSILDIVSVCHQGFLASGSCCELYRYETHLARLLTLMQLKQQSLEQCGQRRASLSFSMQIKHRNTSAILCIENSRQQFSTPSVIQIYFCFVVNTSTLCSSISASLTV